MIEKSIAESVEDLASVFFTPTEISLMLEIKVEDMLDASGCYYKNYQRGRLQSEADLRVSIKKLANSGSSPAQAMMMDILKRNKAKEIAEG